MRTDGRESDNVEDRRGVRIPVGRRTLGGGIGIVAIVLAAMLFGVDPRIVFSVLDAGVGVSDAPVQVDASRGRPTDEMGRFVGVVLADTEDTWHALFRQAGRDYSEPRLVLFSDETPSACGMGQSAAGPFYCPADRSIYIDLAFYRLLRDRFQAPGDFAQAYVIAHEVGHHLQNQLGIMAKMDSLRPRTNEAQFRQLSIRLELQADCFAGIWAHHAQRTRQILESGDLEEALRAASAIGDDTIQRRSRGVVVPESFTHGSAEQRMRWFRAGFDGGRSNDCNTFDATRP
jgi:predicted metalloprotease